MIKIKRIDLKPITFIGECAGECYGADTSDAKANYERGLSCLEDDHGRTFEYPDVTIIIDGYSARVIREIYTHIIGTSRLQASTRYINYGSFNWTCPPSVEQNEEAFKIFTSTVDYIQQSYRALEDLKIPKEDIAEMLPLCMTSRIVLKINLRAILHMCEVRQCSRAYHRFRAFVRELKEVLKVVDEEWRILMDEFALTKCEKVGFCKEKKSCGLYPKRLRGGQLLYSEKNAFRCPMYRDSHIHGCVYSPKAQEACEQRLTMEVCMRCPMKLQEIEYDKNPAQKNPVLIKQKWDKFFAEGGIAEV